MQEMPTYAIRPNALRVIVPSFLLTAFLCSVFYIGIYINVSLLGISIPGNIQILIISILALLTIIQSLLSYVQSSKTEYLIYSNRVQIGQQYVMFDNVQSVLLSKNIFDALFNTATITVGNLKITGVTNPAQIHSYLNQMLQYSRSQYNQI